MCVAYNYGMTMGKSKTSADAPPNEGFDHQMKERTMKSGGRLIIGTGHSEWFLNVDGVE